MAATPPPDQTLPPDKMSAQAVSQDVAVSAERKQDLTATDKTFCPVLDLSAELRNEIWELAFITDNAEDEEGYIDLVKSKPPSRALLLVSRQTYQEAKGMYRSAYRRYWSESKFTLHLHRDRQEEVRARKESNLNQISNLKVTFEQGHHIELKDTRGIWYFSGNQRSAYFVVFKGDAEELRFQETFGDAERALEGASRVPLAEFLVDLARE